MKYILILLIPFICSGQVQKTMPWEGSHKIRSKPVTVSAYGITDPIEDCSFNFTSDYAGKLFRSPNTKLGPVHEIYIDTVPETVLKEYNLFIAEPTDTPKVSKVKKFPKKHDAMGPMLLSDWEKITGDRVIDAYGNPLLTPLHFQLLWLAPTYNDAWLPDPIPARFIEDTIHVLSTPCKHIWIKQEQDIVFIPIKLYGDDLMAHSYVPPDHINLVCIKCLKEKYQEIIYINPIHSTKYIDSLINSRVIK